MKILIALIFFFTSTLHAQTAGLAVAGDVAPGLSAFTNYIKNPSGWSNATVGISTSSATATRDTDAADKLDGKASIVCDASAQNGYCAWATKTIQEGDKTGNCEARITYKGDASLYKLRITDTTNTLVDSSVLSNVSDWTEASVNYPCGSTRDVRLVQTESGTGAAVNVGRVYYGKATNVGSVNQLGPLQSFTPTISNGAGTISATIEGFYRQIGDHAEIRYHYVYTSGTGAGADFALSLPSSLVIDTTKLNSSGNSVLGSGYYFTTAGGFKGTEVRLYTTSSVRFSKDSAAAYWQGTDFDEAGSVVSVTVTVPIVGWKTQSAISANQTPWYIDANISGASVSLSASDQASYVGLENSGLTLTNNTGSATAQIPCSSTNPPSGTTCSAGDESIGIAFTPPFAGTFLACADFTHYISNGASGKVYAGFQIVETPTNAQTITTEGKTRVESSLGLASADTANPLHVCGMFTFSSVSQKALRLFYEQDVTATVSLNTINADAAAGVGQRDIHWTVFPVTQQMPMPLLVGSVSSGSTGMERTERVAFGGASSTGTNCTSNPCTIQSQSGSWIGASGAAWTGTGLYTVTWASGTFSGIPVCHASGQSNGANIYAPIVAMPSSTAVSIAIRNTSGTLVDGEISLECRGPR